MQSIPFKTHVGADGVLNLKLPVGVAETDLEGVVVVQTVVENEIVNSRTQNGSGNGWPPGFLERTYGSLAHDPIERAPQGEYEVREELL